VRPILRTVRATGLVGFDDTRVARIRPLTRGRLLETRVELGTRVQAQQILATYDHVEISDLTGQLAVARAGLARARAEADAMGKALDRNRELLAIGGVARAELERRSADAARADAGVRAQEAEIAMIGEKLRRFGVASSAAARTAGSPIQAPIDGIVVKIDVVPGEIVDVDRELFTIADLSTVWVQADVLEKDLGLIRPGLDASIGVAGHPDRRFAGRVNYVADMLDPQTNTARVRCAVANPDGALKLNMFASVEIAVPTGRAAATVPPGALQYVDEKPVIFVRKSPDGFERRDVRLGVEARDWIEILDGVTPDEAVVTTGSFQLKSILLHDRIAGD
jgi:cobalt-zinc-cadmium efflux system membrane fusion protein